MQTATLWYNLRHPSVQHPLFRYIVHRDERHDEQPIRFVVPALWLIVFLLFVRLLSGRGLSAIFSSIFLASLVIALVSIFIKRLGNGVPLAMQIAATLTALREDRRYDLLCLLPGGEYEANWLVATGCLYRALGYNRLYHLSRHGWARRWAIIGGGGVVMWLIGLSSEAGWMILYIIIVISWSIATFVYLDNVQGMIAACLVGMLVAGCVGNRNDARVWAVALVMTLQVLLYTLIAIVVIALLQIYTAVKVSDTFIALTLPMATTAIVSLLRELLIRILYRSVMTRLAGIQG